jgi:PleD family two-component response regulator
MLKVSMLRSASVRTARRNLQTPAASGRFRLQPRDRVQRWLEAIAGRSTLTAAPERVLNDADFVPAEAKDADEAIAILQARSDITVLLTDVQMPGSMDGVKLAHAVRDRSPPIKIVGVWEGLTEGGQSSIGQPVFPNRFTWGP